MILAPLIDIRVKITIDAEPVNPVAQTVNILLLCNWEHINNGIY